MLLWWGAGLLLSFIALMIAEVWGIFARFDSQTTIFLQSVVPRFLDTPLSIFSLAGSLELTTITILLFALLIFKCEKRVYYPLAFFGIIMVLEMVGKLFLYHPGPPSEFFRFNLPVFFPSSYVQTGYSFPSGHVSRTAFLAVFAIFLAGRYIRKKIPRLLLVVYCLLFVALMVISRVYLGEHWASDVFGGILLGSSMALFAVVYY